MVGDEPQFVVLFRCIQSMNDTHPYNTCYTGGETFFSLILQCVFNMCGINMSQMLRNVKGQHTV